MTAMKIASLLTAATLMAATPALAQSWVADTAVTGADYVNDVFYHLPTGVKTASNNTNWDLAFQVTPYPTGKMSVLANHVQDAVNVYSLHLPASTYFESLSAADTVGLTGDAHKLYNNPETWNKGAFNRNNNPSNPFDFSWGMYEMATHKVVGDSLYLITVGNAAYKLWLQEYNSQPAADPTWTFRIASWDNSLDTTIVLHTNEYGAHNFAYFSAKDVAFTDREPNHTWDLLFTRYIDTASMPGFGTMMYPVAGVLINNGVEVAVVTDTDPDVATDAGATYTTRTNAIGYNWKHNAMGAGYVIDTNTSFFVKSLDSTYWQVVFTGFTGKSTGTYTFKKRELAATGITTANQQTIQLAIAPQPANDRLQIMLDAPKNAPAQLTVVDLNGRVVLQRQLSMQQGMNAFSIPTSQLPNGMYLIRLSGKEFQHVQKLLVQH